MICKVFNEQSDKPIFFVANRRHHADIGGLTPGSTSLKQEGAVFRSFKIVLNGEFMEKIIFQILKTKPIFHYFPF